MKVGVLPLVRKDGQPELAREVYAALKPVMQAEYDESGSIGKRYRRQDEIGTPWCVTIDHQSLEDGTVTVRDRDSLEQERVAIDELPGHLLARLARALALAQARLAAVQTCSDWRLRSNQDPEWSSACPRATQTLHPLACLLRPPGHRARRVRASPATASAGPDHLRGGPGADRIIGHGGPDRIEGRGAGDTHRRWRG